MATTLFHEAGGLPSPQQMDERGIPAFPAAKWLDGAEKRCPESLVPINLCQMCEIGGIRYNQAIQEIRGRQGAMYDICLTVSAWCIIGLLGVSSRENYPLARGDCYDFLPDSTHV